MAAGAMRVARAVHGSLLRTMKQCRVGPTFISEKTCKRPLRSLRPYAGAATPAMSARAVRPLPVTVAARSDAVAQRPQTPYRARARNGRNGRNRWNSPLSRSRQMHWQRCSGEIGIAPMKDGSPRPAVAQTYLAQLLNTAVRCGSGHTQTR